MFTLPFVSSVLRDVPAMVPQSVKGEKPEKRGRKHHEFSASLEEARLLLCRACRSNSVCVCVMHRLATY